MNVKTCRYISFAHIKQKRCIIAAAHRQSFCNLKSFSEELCASVQKIVLDNYIICGDFTKDLSKRHQLTNKPIH